jgi:hypothetical protein
MTDCAGAWHPKRMEGWRRPAPRGLTCYAFVSSKPSPEVTAAQVSGNGPLLTTPAA